MKFLAALRVLSRSAWLSIKGSCRHLFGSIGFRELLLLAGSGLLGLGCSILHPAAGFIAPGAVLLYVAIRGVK